MLECTALEIPALLDVDLTGLDNHDLRVLLGQSMSRGGPMIDGAASLAMNGDIDDVRAYLESGWVGASESDLRIRVNQIMSTARPEVREEANAALDAGTIEAAEDFLRKYNYEEQPPVETTTTTTAPATTTTTAPGATTSTTVAGPGGTPVPAPAIPIRGAPNVTG